MHMMKVIEIKQAGAAEVLVAGEREAPVPQPGDVLIRVAAAGLNGADIAQREGNYPRPPGASDILGLEASGTIEEIGSQVTGFSVGDRVCALLAGGGYAEYCAVPAGHVLPLPESVSLADGAGLMEAVCTVWLNLIEIAKVQPEEWVMVHGGSSGIGTAAIQILKALGAKVVVTASSAAKCDACRALGADLAINYREQDFVSEIKALPGKSVNVILDIVGGDYLERNLLCLAAGGRLVNIAFSGGRFGRLDIARMMMKGLTLAGSTLRGRSDEEKSRIINEVRKHVWPLVESGKLQPVIDSVYEFDDVQAAHKRLESSKHVGKIVLSVR